MRRKNNKKRKKKSQSQEPRLKQLIKQLHTVEESRICLSVKFLSFMDAPSSWSAIISMLTFLSNILRIFISTCRGLHQQKRQLLWNISINIIYLGFHSMFLMSTILRMRSCEIEGIWYPWVSIGISTFSNEIIIWRPNSSSHLPKLEWCKREQMCILSFSSNFLYFARNKKSKVKMFITWMNQDAH